MQLAELSPELADAADVLSDQLRAQLHRLAVFLAPHADRLEKQFRGKLTKLGFDPQARGALVALTPGAAARILAKGLTTAKFIEHVEYNGRRLAKLNLPPSQVLQALQEYDGLLKPVFRGMKLPEAANFQWVREQIHFCVILTLNNAYYQVRETETQAFYELFRVELESRNLDELLSRCLQTLVEVSQADTGQLHLLNEERTEWSLRARSTPRASRNTLLTLSGGLSRPADERQVERLSRLRQIDPGAVENELLDPTWKKRYKSCWSVPLAAGDRMAGVMQFGFVKQFDWLPREQELLSAAAERCLMAAEKARLLEDLAARQAQVRQLAENMLHVEERERRRISRELHDEAGQSLLCMRLQMEMLENSLPPDKEEWLGRLREVRDLTERTIIEMRRLIAALSPAVLEQLGLGAALRQLVNRFRRVHPVRVKLQLAKLVRLPQGTEIIIYRLVQECFNNIAKHSQATAVNISVVPADGQVRVKVEDNGIGFKLEEALTGQNSFGLSGMRERVALLGGQFELESQPAGESCEQSAGSPRGLRTGTRIRIVLPVPDDATPSRKAPHAKDIKGKRSVKKRPGRISRRTKRTTVGGRTRT